MRALFYRAFHKMDPSRANRHVDLERRMRAAEWPLPVLPVHLLLAHELEHAARKEAVAEGSYLREFLDNDIEASRAQVDADEALRLARLEQLTLATRYESAPALLRQSNRREYQRADDCAAHARGDTNIPTYDSVRLQALRHIATTHGDPLKDAVYAQASSSSDVVDLFQISAAHGAHAIRTQEMIDMLDVASEGTMRGTVFNMAWRDDMPSVAGGMPVPVHAPAVVAEPRPKAEPGPIPAAVPFGVRERASTWASEGGRNPYRVRVDLQPVGSFAPLDEPNFSRNVRVLFLAQQGDTARRDWLQALWARYEGAEHRHRQEYGGAAPFSVDWLVSNMANRNQDPGEFDQAAYSERWPTPYTPMVDINARDFDFATVYAQPGTVPSTPDRVIESSWDPTIRYYPFTFYKRAAVAGSKAALYKYCYLMWRVIRGHAEEADREGRYVPRYPRVGPDPGPSQIDRRPWDTEALKNEMDTIFRLCQGGLSYLDTHDTDEQVFFHARGHLRRGMTPEQFDELFFATGHEFKLDFAYYQQDALYTAAIRPRLRAPFTFWYRTATVARNAFSFARRGIDGAGPPQARLAGVADAMADFIRMLGLMIFVEGVRLLPPFQLLRLDPNWSLPETIAAVWLNISLAQMLLSGAATGIYTAVQWIVQSVSRVQPERRRATGPWPIMAGEIAMPTVVLQAGYWLSWGLNSIHGDWPRYHLIEQPDRASGLSVDVAEFQYVSRAVVEAQRINTRTQNAVQAAVRRVEQRTADPRSVITRADAAVAEREEQAARVLLTMERSAALAEPTSARLTEAVRSPPLGRNAIARNLAEDTIQSVLSLSRALEVDSTRVQSFWAGGAYRFGTRGARENEVARMSAGARFMEIITSLDWMRVVGHNAETLIRNTHGEQLAHLQQEYGFIADAYRLRPTDDGRIGYMMGRINTWRRLFEQAPTGELAHLAPDIETVLYDAMRAFHLLAGAQYREEIDQLSTMGVGRGNLLLGGPQVRRLQRELDVDVDLVLSNVFEPAGTEAPIWRRLLSATQEANINSTRACLAFDGYDLGEVEVGETPHAFIRSPPTYRTTKTTPYQLRLTCAALLVEHNRQAVFSRRLINEDPRALTVASLWARMEPPREDLEIRSQPPRLLFPTEEDKIEAERVEQAALEAEKQRLIALLRAAAERRQRAVMATIQPRIDLASDEYQLSHFTMGIGRRTGLSVLYTTWKALPVAGHALTPADRQLMKKWNATEAQMNDFRFVSMLTGGMNYRGGKGHAAYLSRQYWLCGFVLPFLDAANVWHSVGGWSNSWSAVTEALADWLRDADRRFYDSIILLDVSTGVLTNFLDHALGWDRWAQHWHVSAAVVALPFIAALAGYVRSTWQWSMLGDADDLVALELRLRPLVSGRNVEFVQPGAASDWLAQRERITRARDGIITWAARWARFRTLGSYLYHIPARTLTLLSPLLDRFHWALVGLHFYTGGPAPEAPSWSLLSVRVWENIPSLGGILGFLGMGVDLFAKLRELIESQLGPNATMVAKVIKSILVLLLHGVFRAILVRIDRLLGFLPGRSIQLTPMVDEWYMGTYPLNLGVGAWGILRDLVGRGIDAARVPLNAIRRVGAAQGPGPAATIDDAYRLVTQRRGEILRAVAESEDTRLAYQETAATRQVWARNPTIALRINHGAWQRPKEGEQLPPGLGTLFTMGGDGDGRLPPVLPLDARSELGALVLYANPPMVKAIVEDWRDADDGDDLTLSYNISDTSSLLVGDWDTLLTVAPGQEGNTMLS